MYSDKKWCYDKKIVLIFIISSLFENVYFSQQLVKDGIRWGDQPMSKEKYIKVEGVVVPISQTDIETNEKDSDETERWSHT